MDNIQENELQRQQTAHDYLEDNSSTTALIKGYDKLFLLFQGNLEAIKADKPKVLSSTTKITESKNSLKDDLIEQGQDLSNRLVAFFTVKEDDEKKGQVRYQKTDFARAGQAGIIDLVEMLLSYVKDFELEFAAHDDDAAFIPKVKKAIADYKEYLTKPQLVSNETKAAGERIDYNLAKGKENLDKINDLVKGVATKYPDFAKGFADAIRTIKGGTRSTTIILNVKDTDGTPLEKASLLIAAKLNGAVVNGSFIDDGINKKSGPKGQARLKNLAEGVYTVTITKPGYKTSVSEFVVVSGDGVTINIILEKE